MKKNTMIKMVSMFAMALVILFSLSAKPVEAASYDYSYYGSRTVALKVTTRSSWYRRGRESITFRNYRMVYETQKFSFFRGFYKCRRYYYPTWTIKAVSLDGRHVVVRQMSGSYQKLRLKRNKTYRIYISYGQYNWMKGSPLYNPRWTVKGVWRAVYN